LNINGGIISLNKKLVDVLPKNINAESGEKLFLPHKAK